MTSQLFLPLTNIFFWLLESPPKKEKDEELMSFNDDADADGWADDDADWGDLDDGEVQRLLLSLL